MPTRRLIEIVEGALARAEASATATPEEGADGARVRAVRDARGRRSRTSTRRDDDNSPPYSSRRSSETETAT